MVNFTCRPLYPGNNSGVHWMGRWEDLNGCFHFVEKIESSCPYRNRTPDRPARSLVAIPMALLRLLFKCCTRVYYVLCVRVCVCVTLLNSLFWEADSHSEGQGITWKLGNPYIHCCVYNSRLLVSIVKQMHIVHILAHPSRKCNIYLNIIFGLQVSFFHNFLPPPHFQIPS